MGIFPDMKTKKRNFDIKEPATKTLAWGLVLAAAGTVCIAYLFEKTDEDNNLKLVLPVIGDGIHQRKAVGVRHIIDHGIFHRISAVPELKGRQHSLIAL